MSAAVRKDTAHRILGYLAQTPRVSSGITRAQRRRVVRKDCGLRDLEAHVRATFQGSAS